MDILHASTLYTPIDKPANVLDSVEMHIMFDLLCNHTSDMHFSLTSFVFAMEIWDSFFHDIHEYSFWNPLPAYGATVTLQLLFRRVAANRSQRSDSLPSSDRAKETLRPQFWTGSGKR